jgi:hypothetical protein
MATAVTALIARARRDIQHHFFSSDAVRPERSVPFVANNRIEQRQFEQMCAKGIIRESSPGKFWLDVVEYDDEVRRRMAKLRIALLLSVGALAAAALLGLFAA